MAPLPTPVRAALGLAVNAVEAARTLPDRVVELPVLAVSTALQVSLRAQQRYTELALRGDELLGRMHAPPEEPPSWATFDDDVSAALASEAPAPGAESTAPEAAAPEAVAPESAAPVGGAPADIPISTPADEAPAAVKSAAKQPRARKKTAAAAKTTARTAAKPVRAPRQTKPSAFDRTETPSSD